jgi:hypothetical protein
MRIVAAIHPPEAIRKILECLGLPCRPPPIAAAAPELDMDEQEVSWRTTLTSGTEKGKYVEAFKHSTPVPPVRHIMGGRDPDEIPGAGGGINVMPEIRI